MPIDTLFSPDTELAPLRPAADQGDERTPDAPQDQEEGPTTEELEAALKDTVRKFEREADVKRRHHVRRFLEAEEYWRGNQHIIWSERQFRYMNILEHALQMGQSPDALPKHQYVTNLYQSLGLTVIAAISQKLPKVRFAPASAKNERDLATSKAAGEVAEVIEQNNSLDMLSIRYAYLMWTQGIFGAYVRYVLDEDFGTQEIPQIEMAPVRALNDRYQCSVCAQETDAEQVGGMGLTPQGMSCPQCGTPLSDMDFRPEEWGEGPVITGTIKYPNGQEVITVYGGLNLKLMPEANTAKESPFVILVEEQHVSSLRAAYPKKWRKIGQASEGATAEDSFEKNARLALSDSPGYQKNLQPTNAMVTYTRAWLRNWALWTIDDERIRTKLLEMYPDGVMVALAGDEVLECRSENLDKHWEICAPMPGVGAYREAVGGSIMPVQKRYNDASNVQAEHVEFGSAPPVFFDARYISREALEKRRMQPANFFPIVTQGAPAGTDITKLMYQPQLKIDSNIYQYGNSLVEMAQILSGANPSLFGGPIQNMETSSGYAQARQQAMGKLQLFWRSVKHFQARLMLKAVECFRENRTDDVERVIFGKSGDYTSKFIHLEDLRGNITAKPEADEDFPATWAEIRENIIALIQQVPDMAQRVLMHPANAPMLRKFIANNDLVLPMEDDREKQYREIYEMLEGAPDADPMTGEMNASIQPEPFVDDHDAHIMTAKEWAVSDEGIEQKKTNPIGYANVLLHIVAHYKAKAEAEAAVQGINGAAMMPLQQAAAAMAPPAPEGEAGGVSGGDTGGESAVPPAT